MDLLNKLSPPEFGPLFTKPGWLAKIISTNRDLYRKCESDVFYKKKAHILSIRTSSNTADISDLLQHFMITFQDDHETLTNLSTINCILTVLLRYFHLTNFFWMFVEGLFGL